MAEPKLTEKDILERIDRLIFEVREAVGKPVTRGRAFKLNKTKERLINAINSRVNAAYRLGQARGPDYFPGE